MTPRLLAAFYIGPGDKWYTRLAIPLIRLWDKSKITHCELVADYGDDKYWFSSEPGNGVSVHRNPERNLDNWVFLDIRADERQISEISLFFSNRFGSGYDWLGVIFSLFIPVRWESKNNWFCSEICRAALHSARVHIPIYLRAKDYEVTPAELYNELRLAYSHTHLS